jgi:hypothetical protein
MVIFYSYVSLPEGKPHVIALIRLTRNLQSLNQTRPPCFCSNKRTSPQQAFPENGQHAAVNDARARQ